MDQNSTATAAPQDPQHLLAGSPHAELVVSPDLRIVACTDAYLRTLGVERKAIVGKGVREAFVAGPDLERLVGSLELVGQSRRPQQTALQSLVPSAAPASAGRTPFRAVNIPVLGADGGVRWILHSLETSIDERSAMAQALEAAEARLRSILQTVPDAMVIIDEQGRIESLSTTAERLFGYTMAEAAGQNISLFMPSPYREQHDAYIKRYLSTGERRIIGIGRIVVGQR
ncbi:MAG TPA: PAS domain S-box protein, partial [Reyranella sp.]|nr:PAS domain S-box protein [Reyranella sp.]